LRRCARCTLANAKGLKLTHPISKERKGPVNFLLMPFLSHEASQ
jgi:hypothetical protein